VIVVCIVHLVRLTSEAKSGTDSDVAAFNKALRRSPMTLVLVIYTFLAMLFVVSLTVYHHFLVSKNLTTNEHLKKYFKTEAGNPFDKRSYLKNLFDVAIRNVADPLFDPRAPLNDHKDEIVEIEMPTLNNKSVEISRRINNSRLSEINSNGPMVQIGPASRLGSPRRVSQNHTNFSISQNHQMNDLQFQPGEILNAEEETGTDSPHDNVHSLQSIIERREERGRPTIRGTDVLEILDEQHESTEHAQTPFQRAQQSPVLNRNAGHLEPDSQYEDRMALYESDTANYITGNKHSKISESNMHIDDIQLDITPRDSSNNDVSNPEKFGILEIHDPLNKSFKSRVYQRVSNCSPLEEPSHINGLLKRKSVKKESADIKNIPTSPSSDTVNDVNLPELTKENSVAEKFQTHVLGTLTGKHRKLHNQDSPEREKSPKFHKGSSRPGRGNDFFDIHESRSENFSQVD